MPRPKEPRWLSRLIIDSIHIEQLREHGGLPGIRDENALESALAPVRNKRVYGEVRDLAALAAAYGFALVSNHPFFDGNKRIGFLSIVTFLGINGRQFDATDLEVVTQMLKLAAGQLSEKQLADWIREHTTR